MNDNDKIEALRWFEEASIAFTNANNTGKGVVTAKKRYVSASKKVLEAVLGRKPNDEELARLTERP